jgi:Rrf2 family transcriptional regulator, cysteine metabolism repressor
MRISMKSEYALRALMELASTRGSRYMQTSEIASRRAIPESYLEQLLTTLRRAGLVVSVRGPQGGHTLAMPAARITAGDVVRALEGPLIAVDCGGPDRCQFSPNCALEEMWGEVRSAVDSSLNRFSIEDLSAREAALGGQIMYHI